MSLPESIFYFHQHIVSKVSTELGVRGEGEDQQKCVIRHLCT